MVSVGRVLLVSELECLSTNTIFLVDFNFVILKGVVLGLITMGVPKFYRWVSERYPCLSQVIQEHQVRLKLIRQLSKIMFLY